MFKTKKRISEDKTNIYNTLDGTFLFWRLPIIWKGFFWRKHSGDSNSPHFPKMSSFYTPSPVHQKTISSQWDSSSPSFKKCPVCHMQDFLKLISVIYQKSLTLPMPSQALYIRKLFPLNETPILVVTIFIKIGSQLSPCKNKFLTNFINHYHLQYHDNWQGRRQKSFLYKYIHQKWKTLACVVMEVLIQSICGS